jgi:[protein-PII] uridylyltransferase
LRCVGNLQEIERGGNDEFIVASDLMRKIQPGHRAVIYVAVLLHDIAKGLPEDHSTGGAKVARRLAPRLGFNAADTELIAWLIETHLTMSTVAQSRDLSDRKTIENFAAVVQSVEQMKLLTILTTADIRGVGPGVWNGWKAQLLRTLYYETEPVLTGGFSEVNRAERIRAAQAEFRAAFTEIPEQELNAYISRHYPAYWLKVELSRKLRHARFLRASEKAGHKLAINVGFDEARGVTELTILAIDHPWLLSIIAGSCASAGANIVDAQIYTTTDGRALDTIAISREYDRDEDEGRRATRIGEMIEDILEGKLRLPEVVARRAASRGKLKPFVVEPEVIINNQWSDRYTVIEVSGLDRPGLLYQLTTAISKLNLNIASAHVATFGERARDVFYVTDLLGAQITAPTRQAAIKRALIHLLANGDAEEKPAA